MEDIKTLIDAMARLRPGVMTLAELNAMEEALQAVEKELQKMRRHLSEDEHCYDAIQARYGVMIRAAEDLRQQTVANPPNKAELEVRLAKLTDQIEQIALELDLDAADVVATRAMLGEMEAVYQQKIQDIAQALAKLQSLNN